MEWASLKVIASMTAGRRGICTSPPIVKDVQTGTMYWLYDIQSEHPTSQYQTYQADVRESIDDGYLVGIPEWPAEKGKIIVAASNDFMRSLEIVGFSEPMSWVRLSTGDWSEWFAYVDEKEFMEWRAKCFEAFMNWIEPRMAAYLKDRNAEVGAHTLCDMLWDARYLISALGDENSNRAHANLVIMKNAAPELFSVSVEKLTSILFMEQGEDHILRPMDAAMVKGIIESQRQKLSAL